MNPKTLLAILELIDLVATTIAWSQEARHAYDELRREVTDMVERGEDPTAEQWSGWLTRSKQVRDDLRRKAGLDPIPSP